MINALTPANPKQLRSFGLIMATFFLFFVALMPYVLHRQPIRVWGLPVAVFFLLPALFFPQLLKPLYKVWMSLGLVLGWINSRIILTIIFYCIITPLGLARRLMGNDPLKLKFDKRAETYREKMHQNSVSMERQF